MTAVLSADYQDLTGNGPTDDDLGSYTKINYSKIADKNNPYQWRVPFQNGKANYNEGFRHRADDDRANYIYGKKELAYVHSIVTKTHVAEFTISDRFDGYGVASNEGGQGTIPYKKLDKITLYAKPDKINNSNPTPIKEVHFTYDYELCPGTENSTAGGKLTLRSLHYTYGKSEKGKLSPYSFEYGQIRNANGTTTVINPSYNLKGYDRWGYYKPNEGSVGCLLSAPLTNSEFPYTPQEELVNGDLGYDPSTPRTKADVWAAAWNLSTINLPSGGKISVDYEADDYAYVQDKKAMQMFKVAGCSKNLATSTADFKDQLYARQLFSQDAFNYVYFKLEKPLNMSQAEASRYIKRNYLTEQDGTLIDELYFKFLTKLGQQKINPDGDTYEYVPGYAKIIAGGAPNITDSNGAITHGFVRLVDAEIDDEDVKPPFVHPVAQTAWNFTKINLPRIAYNQPDIQDNAAIQIFEAIASALLAIRDLFTGFNDKMRQDLNAHYFKPDKSWIRLISPEGEKEGGGSRVKKIAMSDEWQELTNQANHKSASYGQVYDYTTEGRGGKMISSGVASWEPMVGGDENPFRLPIFVTEKVKWAPDNRFYKEKPIGESFYAGASVGYSKVTVKNLQYANVQQNATGKVVHEFYTAKDYPTRNSRTDLQAVPKKVNPIFKLLKVKNYEYMTATQGFVVELNNMHGKPKGQQVYQENKATAISSVRYNYKTKQVGSGLPGVQPRTRLDNTVPTLNKEGAVVHQTVGVDYDFVVDMREEKTNINGSTIAGNLDLFLATFFPIPIPSIFPGRTREETRFRSATTTKVINRYGIMEEIIATDLGSEVSTKNIAWDSETGNVLLTETVNEHDDPVFAFTYPAHWGYDRMGHTYKNQGLTIAFNAITNPHRYFVLGDEIGVAGGGTIKKAWITQIDAGVVAVDRYGENVPLAGKTLKVLVSGRNNMAATPIGNVTTLHNPLYDSDGDGIADALVFDEVVNASAVEMKEEWGLFCECGFDPSIDTTYNRYVQGVRGNWRPARSYLHLTGRSQSNANNNTNTRKDGVFTSFTPFWNANNGKDWTQTPQDWTFTSAVTKFSPYGFELENKDALGRYSSAIYGYSNTLPLAVAANAEYKEIAFDGFEDYDYDDCPDDHFSYEAALGAAGVRVTPDESHTGRRSLELGPGASVAVKKVLE